jgi:hypothetical protein
MKLILFGTVPVCTGFNSTLPQNKLYKAYTHIVQEVEVLWMSSLNTVYIYVP